MDGIKILRLDDASHLSWVQRFVLQRWLGKTPAFVRSCRVIVDIADRQELYRLSYVSTERDYSSAERNAELKVGQLLADRAIEGRVMEVQWKRGRFVTRQIIHSETDSVRAVLCQLRKDKLTAIVNIEKVEGYVPRSQNLSGETPSLLNKVS